MSAPGMTSPVSASAARAMITRGPNSNPAVAASGSRDKIPRRTKLASPTRMRSPMLSFKRASSDGAATAPQAPSSRASAAASGCAGSMPTVP
jgi:hypothetical protein